MSSMMRSMAIFLYQKHRNPVPQRGKRAGNRRKAVKSKLEVDIRGKRRSVTIIALKSLHSEFVSPSGLVLGKNEVRFSSKLCMRLATRRSFRESKFDAPERYAAASSPCLLGITGNSTRAMEEHIRIIYGKAVSFVGLGTMH